MNNSEIYIVKIVYDKHFSIIKENNPNANIFVYEVGFNLLLCVKKELTILHCPLS